MAPAIALLAALIPSPQTGRIFDSIEGIVAVADRVAFGRIVECEPQSDTDRKGPVRVRFQVTEAIRGKIGKTLDLSLEAQGFQPDLQTMRRLGVEIMLTVGRTRHWYAGYPVAQLNGEQSGLFAYFRYVEKPPQKNGEPYVSAYLFDGGKIFDMRLQPVSGRRAILESAKRFLKLRPSELPTMDIHLPNDYLRRVGDPNAYATVRVPICPETRETLLRLLRYPEFVLKDVRPDMQVWERRRVLMMAIRNLEFFRDKETEEVVKRFANEGDPKTESSGQGDDLRAEARRLLEKWGGHPLSSPK
ncbi:MAG: hypothetical protein WAO58_00545 [Fimbriimonadaceae bacterium]